MYRYFPNSFADGPVHDLIEAIILSRKRDASGALGADWLYAAWTMVWAVCSTERCHLSNDVVYMRPRSQMDADVADPPNVFRASLMLMTLT